MRSYQTRHPNIAPCGLLIMTTIQYLISRDLPPDLLLTEEAYSRHKPFLAARWQHLRRLHSGFGMCWSVFATARGRTTGLSVWMGLANASGLN